MIPLRGQNGFAVGVSFCLHFEVLSRLIPLLSGKTEAKVKNSTMLLKELLLSTDDSKKL